MINKKFRMDKENISGSIIKEYSELFYISKAEHKKYLKYMPGGTTKSLSYFKPFPIHIRSGKGAYVYSAEGHKLLDVCNAYGALLHGHVDKDVVTAVRNALNNGTQFAAPTETQYRFSKLLCKRMPSLEAVRFCASGTEATLFAIRTARAFTKKNKILKIRGGYHGTHDCVAVSANKQCVVSGVPKGVRKDVLEVSFNDIEALVNIIQNTPELATVIIEPFLGAGGIISPYPNYLQAIREITKKHNVILIFDEIISARMHFGGAQTYYNVVPDLTTLGKIVGGGYPIGVFGGRRDLMDLYCNVSITNPLEHSGTYNGYETALIAGEAALKKYDRKAIDTLNAVAMALKSKILQFLNKLGFNIVINQVSSFLNIHFINEPAVNNEIVAKSVGELHALLHLNLLNKGVYSTPRGVYVLSTAMSSADIQFFFSALSEALQELKPLVIKKYPQLLR